MGRAREVVTRDYPPGKLHFGRGECEFQEHSMGRLHDQASQLS